MEEQPDIVKVIGQVVYLKQEESMYIGECPFCKGALIVNPLNQEWECIKCSPKWDNLYAFAKKWGNRFDNREKEMA